MPKNSAVHNTRMEKVKAGFTAAGLSGDQVTQIMGVFDVLTESNAREVAHRTEFSVTSATKIAESLWGGSRAEDRRQMARALLFASDLLSLSEGTSLPSKPTDAAFELLWRVEFAPLATKVRAKAQLLCETDLRIREIIAKPVIASPRPAPRKIVIAPETRSLFEGTLRNQSLRNVEVRAHQSALQIHKTAWSDAKSGLVGVFATVVNASLSNMISIQTAGSNAYTEFQAFFKAVGKENEAKISMAKSFFEALASYAPFPVSIVGKVGALACGMLHTDLDIPQERQLGPPKYFDSNIPALEKFNAKLGSVTSSLSDLTRIGIDARAMPSGTTLSDAIDSAKGQTVALLNKVFLDAINDTYGATPSEQANKGTEFFLKVQNGLGGPGGGARPELVAQTAINRTNAVFNATKTAIESAGTLRQVSSAEIQPFIELQLMAEYLAVLIPDDDFTKAIPEPLIERLSQPPFEIVVRKTGGSQTDQIYQAKKLPWAADHPRHVGAMVYFFRWYKKNVNPFHLATGKVTARGIRDAMGLAIGEIGAAVQAHKQTRRLRAADDADWNLVSRDVANIRGV